MRKFRRLVLCGILLLVATAADLVFGQAWAFSDSSTATWTPTASYVPPAVVDSVSCAPNQTAAVSCVAVGYSDSEGPSITSTDDGGITWYHEVAPPGLNSLNTVSCPSIGTCYVGTDSGILKTTDNGSTWAVEQAGINVQSIYCLNVSTCTAVGSGIISTSDGTVWRVEAAPPNLDTLTSVSCIGADTCVAVGVVDSRPAIVGTNNGMNWTSLTSPTVGSLSAISCSSDTLCVAVGATATGLATTLSTDNLNEWTTVDWVAPTSIPSGDRLNDVTCPAAYYCLAVGDNGSSPHSIVTTDNGVSWESQPTPNGSQFTGLHFLCQRICLYRHW